MKRLAPVLAACCLALSAPQLMALSFSPSASEWANWPPYCRARYLVSGAGEFSEYRGQIGPAEIAKWKGRTGGDAWYGLHHHCAGLVYFKRAKIHPSDKIRKELLGQSVSESTYALRRTQQANPMYATMLVHIARSNYELGNFQKAMQQLSQARQLHPDRPEPYSAESIFLYRAKKYSDAKSLLLQGIENVSVPSAELHYFLGLTALKLSEFDLAREHAEKAYQLGYRLPGLKRKLASAGYQLNLQ